jgi:ubiquinone/menaquinone biosynthesis C-methylase UbiE
MRALDDAARRAREAFDAAADHYDHPALGFWSRVGARTVERLGLRKGDHVLDVPCGSGASAVAAARAVGDTGRVVAVDLASGLLELARAKAEHEGLANVETHEADMRALDYAGGSFDAVVCVFGVFFVSDPAGLVRELWRLVASGGALAITTWGPRVLEPGAAAFWDAVASERPDLVRGFNPWDDLVSEEQLLELYLRGGISGAAAELEEGEQPLATPEDFWAIALGTGFRGTIELLDVPARERVHDSVVSALEGVDAVQASAVYGLARKV